MKASATVRGIPASLSASRAYVLIAHYLSDYDAPLSEAGDYTNKYHLLRNLFSHYHSECCALLPRRAPRSSIALLLPLLFLSSPSLVNSPSRTCSLLAKAGSLCIWLQAWITDMFLCVYLRVCACVAEMCPSQWPSITAHLQNYILGLLSHLLVRQFSPLCKTRVLRSGAGVSSVLWLWLAFGNLGLNPAQQANNLLNTVAIEDSLKGCLCVIHPYVL